VNPKIRGWFNNLRDDHPIRTIWIDTTVDPNSPHPNEMMGRQP
jgi:hypothetical protein